MFDLLLSRASSEKKFKKLTGFRPHKIHLYELALIPKSAAKESHPGFDNERLEYLGDAVLESIISSYLFQKFPQENEGFLTKIRSKFVNRENLNQLGSQLGLKNYLKPPLRQNLHGKNVLGNILEALIGALYLDCGYRKTEQFVISVLINKFTNLEELVLIEIDFKSHLIEWSQKSGEKIIFNTTEKNMEFVQERQFISKVILAGQETWSGEGGSKKEAEQAAAKETLYQLKKQYPDRNI